MAFDKALAQEYLYSLVYKIFIEHLSWGKHSERCQNRSVGHVLRGAKGVEKESRTLWKHSLRMQIYKEGSKKMSLKNMLLPPDVICEQRAQE
jgi:hypothetical protein